jgi:hypothetical protein
MSIDSALRNVIPDISRPQQSRQFLMHWMSVKLPDNFQIRELTNANWFVCILCYCKSNIDTGKILVKKRSMFLLMWQQIWNRHGHECSRIWKLSGNFTLIQCIKNCRDCWGRDISGMTFRRAESMLIQSKS